MTPILVTIANESDRAIRVALLLRCAAVHRNDVLAALPEGMLEPGESAGGFVYFGPLPSDVRRVVLRAEFRRPGGGRAARLHIPFEMS